MQAIGSLIACRFRRRPLRVFYRTITARIRLSLHSRSGKREVRDDNETSATCGRSPKGRFLDFANPAAEEQQPRQTAKWECEGQMRRRQTQRTRRPSRPPAAMPGPSGPRRMAYLFFCSPARLLRHISRHRERTITIPIMATPSFTPNQMESNVSTVHLSQRVARHFLTRCPISR